MWQPGWEGDLGKDECEVAIVVSDSVRRRRRQPTRLPRPWDFPGKSTGVGCHCLLHPRHYTRALLTGSLVTGRKEIVVGSAAAVTDGRIPPGKEAFLVEVLEVKGERRVCGVVLGRMDS